MDIRSLKAANQVAILIAAEEMELTANGWCGHPGPCRSEAWGVMRGQPRSYDCPLKEEK